MTRFLAMAMTLVALAASASATVPVATAAPVRSTNMLWDDLNYCYKWQQVWYWAPNGSLRAAWVRVDCPR